MSIQVRIPKEIKEYKEKLAFGLTVRQIVSVAITGVICIPTYIWARPIMGDEIASWGVIILAFPCLCFGFFKYNGMTFEQFIYAIIKHSFINPQVRHYKTTTFYERLERDEEEGGK